MLTRMIHTTLVLAIKFGLNAIKSGVDKGYFFVLTYPELINTGRTTPRSLTQFLV